MEEVWSGALPSRSAALRALVGEADHPDAAVPPGWTAADVTAGLQFLQQFGHGLAAHAGTSRLKSFWLVWSRIP